MEAIVQNRVVSSTVQNLHIPEVDVGTFLRRACATFKDRTAIIDASTGKCYTYEQFEELSSRVAAGLWSLGFRPGDVASLHCGTNPEMLFAFYGVVFIGGTIVLAKPDLTQGELEDQLGDVSPSIVFCDQENAKKTLAACERVPSVKTLVMFGTHEDFVPMESLMSTSLEGFEPPTMPNLDATAAVLYTTGTSGLPKPIMITHRIIVAQSLMTTYRGVMVQENDVLLGNLTFTHICGLWLFGTIFSAGGTVVLVASRELNDVLSAIEKYKVSVMFQFPTFVLKLLRSDLPERYDVSSLKRVVVGGSALPPLVAEEIVAKLGIESLRQGYGMSETHGGVILVPEKKEKYDSVGVPFPMTHVKVVDVDTRKKLDACQHGEICIKGPTCTPGYFNRPDSTAKLYDEEGFLQTGDIGYYTEDGYIFIVDRIKDLIKCMDRQVAPAELENMLLKHPDVKEVAVTGVPHVDYGEAARAFVVLGDNALPHYQVCDQLRKLIEDQCPPHKHLHGGVEVVSSIPKSENGKCLRRTLRDAFIGKHQPRQTIQ